MSIPSERVPASPSDPLFVPNGGSGNNDANAVIIQQTLGGTTYRIDPSKTMADAKKPLWKAALQGGAMILATPVLVPTVVLYTLGMWIGPEWLRHKAICKLIRVAMKEAGAKFDSDRKHLLSSIRQGDKVLDLGAGPGYYLKYLSEGCRVVGLEPVSNFHDGYRKLAIEAGLKETDVEVYACEIEAYIREHPHQRASFDWVILGNVLCEVNDQISTLHCVNHLLKPGGHVYFSEHIGAAKGTRARKFQDFLNPLWRTAGGGCNCNRDSLANLRKTPGWQVISWPYSDFKVCMGPFVLGLALKMGGQ